jgi:3-deoxy-manno-octulosonate cytidylyltransferase (CMP-KDO synthetase)
MNFIGIIPARYASSRLPGKPLVDIAGKPMIQWVYEKAAESLQKVVVATDDRRILEAVYAFGGEAIMTSAEHETGTNRCLEAYKKVRGEELAKHDIVINIQGDEPLMHTEQLDALKNCFREYPETEMATLVIPVEDEADMHHNSEVFVTFDDHWNALYFSRSVIPFLKNHAREEWLSVQPYYKHLGLYAFTPAALHDFAAMPASALEMAEGLEQLRWLQNGRKIKVGVTPHQSIPVNTPDDLERVRELFRKKG